MQALHWTRRWFLKERQFGQAHPHAALSVYSIGIGRAVINTTDGDLEFWKQHKEKLEEEMLEKMEKILEKISSPNE